jgi:hypothetical protein
LSKVDEGETVSTVAGRYGVNASTLKWWRTKLRREMKSAPRLVPVVVRPLAPKVRSAEVRSGGNAPIEIVAGTTLLRIAVGSDIEYVRALVVALGRG